MIVRTKYVYINITHLHYTPTQDWVGATYTHTHARKCIITHYAFISPSHLNRGRLEESVAEHLDHLHYIGDILSLGVEPLNHVLIDHLLNRLLIPLYVYSLSDQAWPEEVCGLSV